MAALEQMDNYQPAELYWMHTDLNSAPLEVTDAKGQLRWSGQYEVFGQVLLRTKASWDKSLSHLSSLL